MPRREEFSHPPAQPPGRKRRTGRTQRWSRQPSLVEPSTQFPSNFQQDACFCNLGYCSGTLCDWRPHLLHVHNTLRLLLLIGHAIQTLKGMRILCGLRRNNLHARLLFMKRCCDLPVAWSTQQCDSASDIFDHNAHRTSSTRVSEG
jgi:hypothetical protein